MEADMSNTARFKREEQVSGVRYGCHVDLSDEQEPDGCVLDYGAPQDCTHAHRLRSREGCRYWRAVISESTRKAKGNEDHRQSPDQGRLQAGSVGPNMSTKTYKITSAQRRVMDLIVGGGLTLVEKTLFGVRSDMLSRLEKAGMIRFAARAATPHWRATAAGRRAVRLHQS